MANINKSNTPMTKLNWRDASKELPACDGIDDYLVVLDGVISSFKFNGYLFFYYTDDGVEFAIMAKVTHWLPINEIPLPKE